MLNWLKSLGNWAIGGLDDLWNKIVSVVQAVYSYIDAWVNSIVGDFSWLWNTFSGWINSLEKWVGEIETFVLNYANTLYNDVTSWVGRIWNDLYGFITGSIKWLSDWVNRIVGFFTGWINSVVNWVIRNIWDPLYNSISGVIHWIENEGAWVFYMITHPDQLALLLGRYILAAWIGLGRRYAGAVARWVIHGMIAAAGDVAGILEDFIAGIL